MTLSSNPCDVSWNFLCQKYTLKHLECQSTHQAWSARHSQHAILCVLSAWFAAASKSASSSDIDLTILVSVGDATLALCLLCVVLRWHSTCQDLDEQSARNGYRQRKLLHSPVIRQFVGVCFRSNDELFLQPDTITA